MRSTSEDVSGKKKKEFWVARGTDTGRKTKWQHYSIEVDKYTTILDALIEIREKEDHTLQLRYSCRMAMCGSCAMKINGRPMLACQTLVSDVGDKIKLQPMDHYPVVRDLVTDLSVFFENYRSVKPYIVGNDLVEEQNPKEMIKFPQLKPPDFLESNYCIQCGLCYSACPIVSSDPDYVGPAALNVAYRYSADFRDKGLPARGRVVLSEEGLSRCHFVGECTEVCPKGVNPSFSIQLLRQSAVKHEVKRIFRRR